MKKWCGTEHEEERHGKGHDAEERQCSTARLHGAGVAERCGARPTRREEENEA